MRPYRAWIPCMGKLAGECHPSDRRVRLALLNGVVLYTRLGRFQAHQHRIGSKENPMSPTEFVIFFFIVAIAGLVKYALGYDEKPDDYLDHVSKHVSIPGPGQPGYFMDPGSTRRLTDSSDPLYSSILDQDD